MEDLERSFADVRAAEPPAGLEGRILAAARARRRGWRSAALSAVLVAACWGLNLEASYRVEKPRRIDFEARTGRSYDARERRPVPLSPETLDQWTVLLAGLERRT